MFCNLADNTALFTRDGNAAMQELVFLGRWAHTVCWKREGFAACGRDKVGCDDNHKFRLLAVVIGATEERTEDRQVTEPRHLACTVAEVILQKTCDCEAFTIAQLDCCFGFAALEGIYSEVVKVAPLLKTVVNTGEICLENLDC